MKSKSQLLKITSLLIFCTLLCSSCTAKRKEDIEKISKFYDSLYPSEVACKSLFIEPEKWITPNSYCGNCETYRLRKLNYDYDFYRGVSSNDLLPFEGGFRVKPTSLKIENVRIRLDINDVCRLKQEDGGDIIWSKTSHVCYRFQSYTSYINQLFDYQRYGNFYHCHDGNDSYIRFHYPEYLNLPYISTDYYDENTYKEYKNYYFIDLEKKRFTHLDIIIPKYKNEYMSVDISKYDFGDHPTISWSDYEGIHTVNVGEDGIVPRNYFCRCCIMLDQIFGEHNDNRYFKSLHYS